MQNDKGKFSSTFFNQTVEFYPAPAEDSSGVLRGVVGALLALVAMLITYRKIVEPAEGRGKNSPKGK